MQTLRELRATLNLSLRDVQARTDIWAPHLSEIERGRRLATPEQIAVLSALYGVDSAGWRLMLVHGEQK